MARGSDGALAALAAIGNTPLLPIPLPAGIPGRLLAKAEYLQPGGSIKDRAALGCVEHGLASGELSAGQAVVEMTSGNMGAGLAVVCGVLGHPFTAYMSAGNSPQRAAMMRALGASVVLVDQVDGRPGQVTGPDIEAAAAQARHDAAATGAWYVDQFHNSGSVHAHERTGEEIWQQTDGAVDAFVACVGSAGSLIGCAHALKAHRAQIAILAVEPATSRPLAGRPISDPRHALQGSGYGIVPAHFDPSLVDGYLAVTDESATATRRWLGERCGLHVGYTAAANVAAATDWLAAQEHDLTVVTVLCDTGLKYLSE
ncbi:MAG TPA: cysteine synthase family protein [Mycobacteriales bacterium]|nr:cysteine synthase family protein [Mycobacteriales bacterium]